MDEQRASDADRDRAVERLRDAGGDGRLTVDELDERLERAHSARTRGALAALLSDLGEEPAVLGRGPGSSELTVRPGPGGSRWVVAVLGSATRAGRWRLSPRCTVLSVMGNSSIDLNDVELADDITELTVFSLMGGADIRVPEDLRVEVTDIGIMGSNDITRGRPEAEHRSGPLLRLRLVSVMGAANVKRGRTQAERSEERPGLSPPPAPPLL